MKEKIKLNFEAIAVCGNKAYASDALRNGLFQVDIKTRECIFLCLFDGESVGKERLYCEAIRVDEKIYFIPGNAEKIAVFYPETLLLDYIEVSIPESQYIRKDGDPLQAKCEAYISEIGLGEMRQSIESDKCLSKSAFFFYDDGTRDYDMLSAASVSHETLRESKTFGLNELMRGLL